KGKYRTVDKKIAKRARNLVEIAAALPQAAWKDCSWKATNGKNRSTQIAWVEVYLMRGLKEPNGNLEKIWLVVDWPKGDKEAYHYYLAHFHRRSEEHTSELQSRVDLVCRLLLEKKKK